MALPPLKPGGVNTTDAEALPGVAVTAVGVLGGVMRVNVAVTVVAAFKVTVQVPLPVHPPPDQPVKTEPTDGDAVRVMTVPKLNPNAHATPQLIPAGDDTTAPAPVPGRVTASCNPLMLKVTASGPVPPAFVAETIPG